MRNRVAFSICVAVTACASSAVAQTAAAPAAVASPVLRTWVEAQFREILSSCAGVDTLRTKGGLFQPSQAVSPVPAPVLQDLGAYLDNPYELYGNNGTLTELFGSVWAAPSGASTVPDSAIRFSGYRRLGRLGIDYAGRDDRQTFAGVSSLAHTNNCSSVIGFAADARAELSEAVLTAAIKASYNSTSSRNVSLVAGEFISPTALALNLVPSTSEVSKALRFRTNIALWHWYSVNPTTSSDQRYILAGFNGLARYRFQGLSWETKGDASGSSSASLIGFRAGASGTGRISAEGNTRIDNFAVLRYGNSTPTFVALPNVAAVAAAAPAYAEFELLQSESHKGGITSTAPLTFAHTLAGLPGALCDDARWSASSDVTSLDVSTVAGPEAELLCRFTARFTPPASPAAGGSVPFSYTATLAFPTSAAGARTNDLVFRIPSAPMNIPDARAALSVEYASGSLRTSTGDPSRLEGVLTYVARTSGGSAITTLSDTPVVRVSCGGDPAGAATASGQLVLADSGRPAEIRLTIAQAGLTDRVRQAGGQVTCVVNGSVSVRLSSETASVMRALETARITVSLPAPAVGGATPVTAVIRNLE